MLDFIKDNIGWIKDFALLFFAGTGTIIAILAYRRARLTLLQPIRNEVIKKQSGLLSEILSICQPTNKIDEGVDYLKLVQANVLLHLKDYGFIFKEQNELLDVLNQDISGWLPCGESQTLVDVEIISSFDSEETNKIDEEAVDLGKKRYEEAKKGNVQIDKIYMTKKHSDFMNELGLMSKNPFMPQAIQETLGQLISDINKNLSINLKNTLKQFITEYFKILSENKSYPKFEPIGVYNDFNHQRIHHRQTIDKLVKETRKYLMVDDSWE